ncbi:MAG TPA: CoA pyrophosphatase [Bacteroidales bacterium]
MNQFHSLIKNIESTLSENALPGISAQLNMAPVSRLKEIKNPDSNRVVKKSAVLILFYPENGSTKLVMIKRAIDDSVHSGQIAFPGGKFEAKDKELTMTALRETHEEVGINPELIKIIGKLSTLYIPPSNYDVYPFIAYTLEKPAMKNNYEVEKIIEIDLKELLAPENITQKTINHRFGKLLDVPCFYIQNEIIWGASAMIISELLEVIKAQVNNLSKN